jgi:hypothetical protein
MGMVHGMQGQAEDNVPTRDLQKYITVFNY